MVETQLCKLRGTVTSDKLNVRSLDVLILHFIYRYSMVFVNQTYDMIINTQFHKKNQGCG